MTYNCSSVSPLGYIFGVHTITYTWRHAYAYGSHPDAVCLRTPTVLHCLFMNSSVFCRQAGDEDIYMALRYGRASNIINLLSNLPSAFPPHLVKLYSYLITYHKTARHSAPSSASFVTFEVLQFCFCVCVVGVFKAPRRTDV